MTRHYKCVIECVDIIYTKIIISYIVLRNLAMTTPLFRKVAVTA